MAKDILIVPGSSNIQFSGSAVNDIKLETQDNGSVAYTSNSGSLFTITNSLTGSLLFVMNLCNIKFLPCFEAFLQNSSQIRICRNSFFN